jgi:ribosomal protein L11 methylase PrmA
MKKIGTNKVFACEIDEHAKKESILNFKSNFTSESHHPTFIQNPLEAKYSYDLIAANISGSYLPNNFDKICKIINPDGYLIISGFNINKEHKYSTLAVKNGLKTLKTFKDSPWLSIIFQKK